MLLDTRRAQLSLADDEVARLRDARDSRLEVTCGFVWVTVEGEHQDIVLGAGQSLLIDSPAALTLSALRGPAALRLRGEAAAPAAGRRAHAPARGAWLQRLLAGVTLSAEALA